MAKNSDRLIFSYDQEADVLYVSIGNPKPGISEETKDGIVLRYDVDTNKLIGFTIVDFLARFKGEKVKTFPTHLRAELQLA